jgi:RNA polymerase sigma factor (TIGR02999 family)
LVRAKATDKRGARAERAPLDSGIVAQGASVLDLIALDEALERLATFDARKVRVIELRFFACLTVEETAEVLDVASDTVARDWRLARSWLLQELDPQSETLR